MKKPKRHLITAALPYANGPLHIGHIAGAYLPADTYVRYLRLKGEDVAFICGSDEHGAAITLRAKKEKTSPQAIVDKYHKINKKTFEDFGIGFDIYHRTSSELHHKTAADFFLNLYEKGELIEKTSEQFYDEEHHQFLADRYITGTCPKCSYEGAYGDQCEKCGSSLTPTDLIQPKSTLSGKIPVLRKTKHWYLPMQDHEDWLREFIAGGKLQGKDHHNPKAWKKQVIGQCLSWLDGGLQPRAMTRDLDWGVKVPLKDAKGKVLYVWLDAPIGYISATKKWAEDNNKNWEDYWKDEDTNLVHFIGKDNIVFHCIIFPILLKTHGGFNLPENVPANEFLNLEGDKISTSRNWAVWLNEYLEEFPDKKDELRYVLTALSPEFRDSEFTWKDYQARNNNELVAVLGNFVNRAVVLTHKYYDGKVPERMEQTEQDRKVLEQLKKFPEMIGERIEAFRFREAQAEAMNLARLGNKYLAETEPWKLQKADPERVKTIMNIALEITAALAVVIEPFLPFTAEKLLKMLKIEKPGWNDIAAKTLMEEGHRIGKKELLFEKVEDEVVEKQVNKLKESKKTMNTTAVKPLKDNIDFDDFMKMDMRVGKITAAEKIQKADKLLKLTVETGIDTRTVVSGIAQHFSPDDVIGKQVTVLVNLAPRKIMGVVSQGMILMAENEEGELEFIAPQKGFEPGSVVR